MGYSWTCPFCNRSTTIVSDNHQSTEVEYIKKNADYDSLSIFNVFVLCPHPECKKFTFNVLMYTSKRSGGVYQKDVFIKRWSLIPSSQAVAFPSYIPDPILEDYNEACLIRDLSPKAAATLSRRCLQGMIRNYWGVTKKTLNDEIEAIKDKVDPITWSAINAVRKIGNIGAHMEKDINIIIDVEPDEAQLLIGLIETLMKEWYVTRHEREVRMNALVALAEEKDEMKKGIS